MKWNYCKAEKYIGQLCTDPYKSKYQLRVSPNTNFDKENLHCKDVDLRYLLIYLNGIPKLQDVKNKILSLQQEYDSSSEVNSFYLNGKKAWLDKATRVGLVNSLSMQKANGLIESTLWLDTLSITVNIEQALGLLNALEMYALECYNNTHEHYSEIEKLETIEELVAYDITAGYPDCLNITIQ